MALRAIAARARIIDDLRVLAAQLEPASAQDAITTVARVFPGDPLSERKRLLIEDLFAQGELAVAAVNPAVVRAGLFRLPGRNAVQGWTLGGRRRPRVPVAGPCL